ncbi:MAG: aspartate-semialdehyde dehydrogenase [Cyclobacteriaceae bacterium]|nr:aspartate-semialdehyde dehydrogenase [Cyclobacteriaceae bacterium]MCH8516368.1 aspartate-semialdehyde dehydrogenase [Cyclobacteriaceae bacterium]
MGLKIAVVGATGLVGQEILEVMQEFKLEIEELIPVASARSVGKKVSFAGKEWTVAAMQAAIDAVPDIAIFSAGGDTSKVFAPKFAAKGSFVIDNSSAWRMDPDKPLIVPELNAHILKDTDKIIANPNCSTIQMVLALSALHKPYGIKRIVVSTYQSVTGTGKEAVNQLMDEREGKPKEQVRAVYPHPIDMNVLPHIDVFQENDYTKEEMKMVNETKKIFGDDNIGVTATTVRLPVMGGHSESINVEFHREFDMDELKALIKATSGVVIQDDPSKNEYPMPLFAHKKNEVFVGRIRRDESQERSVNMWVVADNLRKGAATNAVQIAQYLIDKKMV